MQSSNILEVELNELLNVNISSVIEQEKTAFDRLVEPFGKSLVLFGAGNLGQQILLRLRQDGIEPLAFADNNAALWGNFVNGVEVFSPKEAAEVFGERAAFIVTIWSPGNRHRFSETLKDLRAYNCKKILSFVPLFWKYADHFLPNCYLDLPHPMFTKAKELQAVFSLWEDEESRITYLTQIKWRILENYDQLPARTMQAQYFPDDIFSLVDNEVFVDCGAYNGDSIKEFLGHQKDKFKNIIAFEPDRLNFKSLRQYVLDLEPAIKDKITIHQK